MISFEISRKLSRSPRCCSMTEKNGIDIVGFGPVARSVAQKLIALSDFKISSISDSTGTIYPASSSEVLNAIRWKAKGKFSEFWGEVIHSNDTIAGIEQSDASVVVDATNSDYSKPEEAKKRAYASLNAGKHFVAANKVALSFYFSQVFELAGKRDLKVGFGATIVGGRHAIAIASGMEDGEIREADAVLNTSTTFILTRLEEDTSLSLEEACKQASEEGILELDWLVDLDGIDAAAKTSILANILFRGKDVSMRDVTRKGIRDGEASGLIDSVRSQNANKERPIQRVRLVSEIRNGRASVEPKILPQNSPLAVEGKMSAVLLKTRNLGEICVRNFGGGVELTSSVVISDLKRITGSEKKNLTFSPLGSRVNA
jgi:homoserine dehydrogenase